MELIGDSMGLQENNLSGDNDKDSGSKINSE